MNNTRIMTMDELRRVLIPEVLRSQMGLDYGDWLTPVPNPADNSIILFKNYNYEGLEIDPHGRVALDKAQVTYMGWAKGVKLAVSAEIDYITLKPHVSPDPENTAPNLQGVFCTVSNQLRWKQ